MIVPVFKPSKRTMILLIVVAGVFLCIGGFAYYMCANGLSAATADCRAKQQQVEDSKKTSERLKGAENNFLAAQSDLSNLETSVTSKEYIPTMLKQLEGLGTSLHLRVVSVRPQPLPPPPPVPIKKTGEGTDGGAPAAQPAPGAPGAPTQQANLPKPYEEMPIDIEVEGSYWNARNFISRLTEFPKIVAVKQMDMAPADGAQRMGSPTLHVRLRLTAFVFPSKSENKAQPKQVPSGIPAAANARGEGRSTNEG